MVGAGGERLTKVDRSPWRRPPVDGKLGEGAELVAGWTERQTLHGDGGGAEEADVVAGGEEVAGTGGERLTEVDRSPWRPPPVDGKLGGEAEMVGEWTGRQLVKALAPSQPVWSVKMRWWGPGARG